MWNNQNQGGYGGAENQTGGDQGGGYLNSPGGFGSPMSQQNKTTRNRAQNVMPVTTAMVYKASQEDDKFVIDTVELYQVTLVGVVRAVKETNTRVEYELDDMTGPPLPVGQFLDLDDNEERATPMRENTYIRVYGHLREFQGKRNLTAFSIRAVTDPNELTTHILEVIHSHLAWSKQNNAPADGAKASVSGGTTEAGKSNYSGAQAENMNGLNNVQKQVSLVIKSITDDQGISVQQIGAQLRNFAEKSIREAIDFLSSEGHIYSTIDDDHFKSTDSAE